MRQHLIDFTRPLRRQMREHVLQVSIRIMTIQPCRLIKLMIAAARLPLRSDPVKSQFLRPNAQDRIWFSHQLLSMDSTAVDLGTSDA